MLFSTFPFLAYEYSSSLVNTMAIFVTEEVQEEKVLHHDNPILCPGSRGHHNRCSGEKVIPTYFNINVHS